MSPTAAFLSLFYGSGQICLWLSYNLRRFSKCRIPENLLSYVHRPHLKTFIASPSILPSSNRVTRLQSCRVARLSVFQQRHSHSLHCILLDRTGLALFFAFRVLILKYCTLYVDPNSRFLTSHPSTHSFIHTYANVSVKLV